MIDLIRQYPRAFLFSLLLHGSIIALTLLEFSGTPKLSVVSPPSLVDKTIKAEVIDQKKLDQRAEKIKDQEQERKRKQQAIEKRAKEQAIKKAQEKKRALEKKKKAEAEKNKKAEAAKKLKAEQAKRAKAEADKKLKAEQQKKAAEEKKRKAEEARKKAEAEKKRKAEELKRKQEQERLEAERQARLKAEAEQRQKEAELKARLAAEERQRALDSAKNKYIAMITNTITRNWRRPVNSKNNPVCEINIIQGPGGFIVDVTFGKCPGSLEYRRSVELAVLKSDPLPKPEYPELFDRNLKIFFNPK